MSLLIPRIAATCCFLAVLLPALAFPVSGAPSPGLYAVLIKVGGGLVLVWGGFALAGSVETTLLRGVGNTAYKTLYYSSAAASGVGAAHAMSVCYPTNEALATAVFTTIVMIAGLAWLRFYHAAAS